MGIIQTIKEWKDARDAKREVEKFRKEKAKTESYQEREAERLAREQQKRSGGERLE